MPFTFLIDLLYKFKKELFIALAVIALVGGGYWKYTSDMKAQFIAGKEYVYNEIKNTPPKIEIKVTHDTIPVPFPVVQWKDKPGKIDTVYVDSTKTTYAHLDTTVTTKDSVATYKDSIHVGFTGDPFNTFDFRLALAPRKYVTSDTSKTSTTTIAKDFDGLNYGVAATVNSRGAGTLGLLYRYKQVMFGPSLQIENHMKPAPGATIMLMIN